LSLEPEQFTPSPDIAPTEEPVTIAKIAPDAVVFGYLLSDHPDRRVAPIGEFGAKVRVCGVQR